MDDFVHDMLVRLRASGALEKTLLVIMGDHGYRLDSIAKTYIGRLEVSSLHSTSFLSHCQLKERLPFLGLHLPAWFRQAQPAAVAALLTNRARLTTHFDLHHLLRDLAAGQLGRARKRAKDEPKLGISLFQVRQRPSGTVGQTRPFEELSASRTCPEAGIKDKYCTCLMSRPLALLAQKHKAAMKAHATKLIADAACPPPEFQTETLLSINQLVRQGLIEIPPEMRAGELYGTSVVCQG